jgi:hypothetical protein
MIRSREHNQKPPKRNIHPLYRMHHLLPCTIEDILYIFALYWIGKSYHTSNVVRFFTLSSCTSQTIARTEFMFYHNQRNGTLESKSKTLCFMTRQQYYYITHTTTPFLFYLVRPLYSFCGHISTLIAALLINFVSHLSLTFSPYRTRRCASEQS